MYFKESVTMLLSNMYIEQVDQWRQDGEMEHKNKLISDLENKLIEADLDRQMKSRKINELENWMACLTNSTLVAAGSPAEAEDL